MLSGLVHSQRLNASSIAHFLVLFFTPAIVKGLKNVTALAETGEASTATPAPAEVAHVEEPAQPAVARVDPATAPSPTTTLADQPCEEAFEEGSAGEVPAGEDSRDESGSVKGEKESAATEERLQEEAAAALNEPLPKVSSKPKARGELLLDLIRSFRGGMLRVDSNLRAAMFRSLRYLVRTAVVESRDTQVKRLRTRSDTLRCLCLFFRFKFHSNQRLTTRKR